MKADTNHKENKMNKTVTMYAVVYDHAYGNSVAEVFECEEKAKEAAEKGHFGVCSSAWVEEIDVTLESA